MCFRNYQWDPEKAESNFLTHSVDFADSVGVFEDIWALTLKEEIESGEQRFVTLGTDFFGRILVVVYTYRNEDIRLISARPATRRERRIYEQKRTSF
ncbi:MAG: BrnT family toxin [Gemmatimonadetes bacterium]|nr:BrnT family toxin [Gemmatimonadota bacterium]